MSITAARKTHQASAVFVGQSAHVAVVASEDDFVDDVMRVVLRMVPGATPEAVYLASAAIRERWGGGRPYIARRGAEGRSERNDAIRRDYVAGLKLATMEARYGLTQRRILQIIKAK